MLELVELQRKLCSVVGVSSFEQDRAKLIAELARPYCDEVFVDRMGSTIAHIRGGAEGKSLLLSAHMDSIGIIALYVENDGRVRFETLGGIAPFCAVDSFVRFEGGAIGCIRADADTLPTKGAENLGLSDMYVDLCTSSKEETLELIAPGESAAFVTAVETVGASMISPYLDDLLLCSVLLCAMERLKDSPNELWFVFSAQEEIGAYGARVAAQTLRPDVGLALDVINTGDDFGKRPASPLMGGGAVLTLREYVMSYDRVIISKLQSLARDLELECQSKLSLSGGTDTPKLQEACGGIPSACLSVPLRHLHTPSELCRIQDAEELLQLLTEFLRSDFSEVKHERFA